MIELPDFSKAFEYENNFYLSSDITRISKLIAHYELFKMIKEIPGEIVECGVFKGASFCRFATFREIFGSVFSKKIIGFDTFGNFPEAKFRDDIDALKHQISSDGDHSIEVEKLEKVLKHKGIDRNIELVKGDITKTVPKYVSDHPELKISLLNLDVDIYEPSVTVLEKLFPKISKGGIIILDDYGTFPGETKAVDEYFEKKNIKIKKFSFCMTPCYLVKE